METSETLTVERISSQNPSVGHVRELNMWIALEFWFKNWHRVALDTSKEIGFGTFWISASSFEKKVSPVNHLVILEPPQTIHSEIEMNSVRTMHGIEKILFF